MLSTVISCRYPIIGSTGFGNRSISFERKQCFKEGILLVSKVVKQLNMSSLRYSDWSWYTNPTFLPLPCFHHVRSDENE